jgi:hypothetical protein
MRVYRFADVHCVRTLLNGQRNLTNHVARMRTHHATAQDFAPACGMAMGFRGIIKQQLDNTFVATIGNGAARCGPGE